MRHGLLLLNLGTPDSASTTDVRRYLRTFLMDGRVVVLPALLRWLLVHGAIAPFRAGRSARAYQSIWTPEGSPLRIHSEQLAEKLGKRLAGQYEVRLGMRYGNPSIQHAVDALAHCETITILPLFPQYASSSTGSAAEEALRCLGKREAIPHIRLVRDFFDNPAYIRAQTDIIAPHLPDIDHLLFSYHGLPENHLHRTGCKPVCVQSCKSAFPPACYRAQCLRTSALLAEALQLPDGFTSNAFQSRVGKQAWIGPMTESVFPTLRKQGIRRLGISCPGFVADCLETLEEIGIRARATWKALGGESFTLIPCLNGSESWVEALAGMISSSGECFETA